MSQIVILSGPPGAGKGTVAEALCERYDRTVHLETDLLYDSIRMGYVPPWRDGSDRQNHMVSRAAARAATAYAEEMYGVFIDGVIGAHLLPEYIEELKRAGVPVHFVVLLPTLNEIVRRASAREKQIAWTDDMFAKAYALFADSGAFPAHRIDSSSMTAQQTADAVMDACGRGECLVLSPG